MSRLNREKHTLRVMLEMYCGKHHEKTKVPCRECGELLTYAFTRIEKCPFGADKPTCVNCKVHCYGPLMREKVRAVMRYSGPRMPLYHPLLTIMHYLDQLKPA